MNRVEQQIGVGAARKLIMTISAIFFIWAYAANEIEVKRSFRFVHDLETLSRSKSDSDSGAKERPAPEKEIAPEIFDSDHEPGERRVVTIRKSPFGTNKEVEIAFRWIPPGKFMMGSPENEKGRDADEVQHEVTLTKGFWLAETETTQEVWLAVETISWSIKFRGDLQRPVETVSWNQVMAFIEKLNRIKPYSSGVSGDFRLPTEAEWEFACRAGTTTPFNFGKNLNGDRANCDGNFPYPSRHAKGEYIKSTCPVKSFSPNAWGLYDMHGNVAEWCSDWYGEYPRYAQTNPVGPASGSARVLRGGGWNSPAGRCRSAERHGNDPNLGDFFNGFRLVMVDSD